MTKQEKEKDGEMKQYFVTVSWSGSMLIEVQASSRAEAEMAAVKNALFLDTTPFNYGYFPVRPMAEQK